MAVVRNLDLDVILREAVHHATLTGLLEQDLRLQALMGLVESLQLVG